MKSKFMDAHILLEFLSRDDHGFLNEQVVGKHESALLLERYGSFDGCLEIADKLSLLYNRFAKFKEKNKTSDYNTISLDLPSGFARRIDLVIDNGMDSRSLAYLPDSSEMPDDGFFETIQILVGANPEMPERIEPSLLSHELQHAYEDFKLRKTGKSLLTKKDNEAYGRNLNQNPYDDILKKLKKVLYCFNKSELNAYVNSIANTIPKKERYMSVKKILGYVKRNKYYKTYELCFEYVEEITSVKQPETQELVMEYIGKVLKTKRFGTFNAFSKWLLKRSYNVRRKLSRTIPKIVYDMYKPYMPRTMWPASTFPI